MNIQEFPIDCSRSEEWLLNSDILDGSAVLSIDQYKYLFTNTDDFTSMRPLYLADDKMECGKALDQEITYGVYCNTVSSGSSYNHYLFTVVQRELKIVAGQIGWN